MRKYNINKLEALADSALGRITERELRKNLNLKSVRGDLYQLQNMTKLGRKASEKAINTTIIRVEKLLEELPELAVKESRAKARSLEHIFDPASKVTAEKEHYLAGVREFKSHLKDLPSPQMLTGKESVKELELMGRTLFDSLSGKVDRYSDLEVESSTLNLILERLYPNGPKPDLVAQAHHFIEERTFEYFKDDFALLGWKSTNDFPAITLMMEYHINSMQPGRMLSKELKDLAKLAKSEEIYSLTQELIKWIPEKELEKIDKLETLLAKYTAYYSSKMNNAQGRVKNSILDSIKLVEKELSIRKSRKRLIEEAKKLAK